MEVGRFAPGTEEVCGFDPGTEELLLFALTVPYSPTIHIGRGIGGLYITAIARSIYLLLPFHINSNHSLINK